MSNFSSTDFVPARREAGSLLTAAERRLLGWLAARLPRSINSDHLTGLALVSMAGAGAGYWAARFDRRWLLAVVVCLVGNWFGDSLDGTVARVRNQQRPRYGFYVDHLVDCVGVLFLCGGLALSGFMDPLVAIGLLVAYFLLSIEIYLATYALRVFTLSFAGLGPTELRLLLAGGSLALMRDRYVAVVGGSYRLFDVSGVVAIAGIGVTLLIFITRNLRALYRAEPMPRTSAADTMTRGQAADHKPGQSLGRRWLTFNLVGAMGFAVQLGLVWALTAGWGINYLTATLIAVEIAVLHNFAWHWSWTWSDRHLAAGEILGRLARFNLTTGVVSIVANVAATAALVHLGGIHYLAANVIAIGAGAAANFLLSHRVVFAPVICLLLTLLPSVTAHAADLSPAASAAFERDVRVLETRLDHERAGIAPFLWIDQPPQAQQRDEARVRLARGEVIVDQPSARTQDPPGAMRHHWLATALIAGASLHQVVELMQGYDRYPEVYRPTVRQSHVIARDGDRFTVALQLFTKKVISVVLNTEQVVSYLPVGSSRMQVRSVSTRIAEVRDPGMADEREAPIGHDSGFLWRFNNYCALDERVEGTYVQCESLSLTRETPFALGWVIGPFITAISRESLEFTLQAMRTAIIGSANAAVQRSVK